MLNCAKTNRMKNHTKTGGWTTKQIHSVTLHAIGCGVDFY